MEIAIGWFVFSIVVAIIADSRGRSGMGYFFISMLLTPVIGGILALALPNLSSSPPVTADGEAISTSTHVRCPDCRELVRADARKCKHCGIALVPQQL